MPYRKSLFPILRLCIVTAGLLATLPWVMSVNAEEIRAAGAPFWDAVHMKDGSVWRGKILERSSSGDILRIRLRGGSFAVVKISDVLRIDREKNPRAETELSGSRTAIDQGTKAGSRQEAGQTHPLEKPTSGTRYGVGLYLAFPTGDMTAGGLIKAGFGTTLRLGYEFLHESFGLTTSLRMDYLDWLVDSAFSVADRRHNLLDLGYFHIGGDMRATAHLGRAAAFVGLSLGLDVSGGILFPGGPATGVGVNLDAGFDFFFTETIGMGVGLTFHPGFTALSAESTVDASFLGVTVSVNCR